MQRRTPQASKGPAMGPVASAAALLVLLGHATASPADSWKACSSNDRPIPCRDSHSPYGQQSRQYLQQRLQQGSTVRLDEKTTDRYGRLVAEVFNGININLALVEDGQAFVFRQYLRGCNAKEYLDAEDRASRRRYGVWQVEGGISRPWDFRRGRRYRCSEIGSSARAQDLLRQGHTDLDSNKDGEACESPRR
jgi:hypothetical protein